MRTAKEVTYEFTPQGKLEPVATNKLLKIETAFKDLATDIIDLVPECAHRTAALRKLLEAKMTCSQAISHPPVQPQEPKNAQASTQKVGTKQP